MMDTLRLCREKMGLSQKQVAIEIGVKPPTVSQWESGIKTPSRDNLSKLASLYNTTVDYLLRGSDDNATADPSSLSPEEKRLIRDYRSLNEQGQEYIRQTMYMARTIYKKCSDLPNMESKIRS